MLPNKHSHNNDETPLEQTTGVPDRWQLVRDVVVFQVKLMLDSLRDVFLSPISIIAALIGLIFVREDPGRYFNRLLTLGRKSDVWINLFGATTHYRDDVNPSSDAYMEKLEAMLIAEYEKGGLVTGLKHGADDLLDAISEAGARRRAKRPTDNTD